MTLSGSFQHITGILLFFLVNIYTPAHTQPVVSRIDPPFWFAGMKDTSLQLMIYGDGFAGCTAESLSGGLIIKAIHHPENPHYLFLDILIRSGIAPGEIRIAITGKKGKREVINYMLQERRRGFSERVGFGPSDVIYLLMPDRFANGDTANDEVPGQLEKPDRSNPGGRHGGDIKGVINNLGYIRDMGFTALWLNPVQENNMPVYSYHGYAITDHYRIDPRLGTMEDYTNLVLKCHADGIRVIMDLIFNHCGTEHWFIRDLPASDWINHPDTFIRSNFRASTITDPHASQYDRNRMLKGWFDQLMPDLNQNNPFIEKYLLQNTLWWIETTGIDGIRMDTQPYPFKEMMSRWATKVREEYPWFSIVGETWIDEPSMVSYYQETSRNFDGYNSRFPYITDFPLYKAIKEGIPEQEGWSTGMARIYNTLAQDFLYFDPYKNLIFADNHDVARIFSTMGEDLAQWKMAMAFVLTCRGIPAVYSGTELLMTGKDNYESFRSDFPGGWPGDEKNAFEGTGLSQQQAEAMDFIRRLATWRKGSEVVHNGRMTHFVPEDGVYVYFRHDNRDTLMVVMNNSLVTKDVLPARYAEFLQGHSSGREIISGKDINPGKGISIPGKSIYIIDLK